MHDKIQRFSLRKLSVGLASVMVGACIFSVNGKTVKADVTSDQTTQVTKVQDQTVTAQAQSNDVQNEKPVSSDQNSVADQSQNNLLDDLGKQKASAQSGDQAEAKNQENRLVDQINYKLTFDNSTDHKEDLGQNKVAPDETKQAPTTKSDAEKDIVRTSSTQKINNQSNDHADDNSQTQNSQKLDLTKNSQLAKEVLATNLIETNSSPMTNGGFDSSWGTLDVNDWKGNVQGDYYQLTDYTGDANHVIVPNEADFEKAGISTSGKQVGVTSDLMHTIFVEKATATDATVAFSKTGNKQVKAINADWFDTWGHNSYYNDSNAQLSRFDGTNLDVSNVTNMSYMFFLDHISDLSPLASWNTGKVTDMSWMFAYNQISNLSPLAKWNVNNVMGMGGMLAYNKISNLSPLAKWNVNNVIGMGSMFAYNKISNLSPLTNWNVNNVGNMSQMFEQNQISDLSPLTNWNVNNVGDMSQMFEDNQISDLSPLANWKVDKVADIADMHNMFDDNSSIQIKTTPANRIINFVYPEGYTGKTQNSITQTVNVPTEKVKVELTTKYYKPSNDILDWVTKTETPISKITDPVYFQDYTVPTVSNLVPSISTVAKQEADPNKPINVVVTYTVAPVIVHFKDVDENADKDSDAVKQELGKTIQLSGTYGSNVDLSTIKLPANFVLDDTSSNTFGNTTDAYINLKHQHAKSTTQAPATRTIVVHMPDGTTKTYVQLIVFVNNLDKDLVTNTTTNIYTVDSSKSNVTINDQVSTQYQAYVLKDGVVNYAPIKLPHINGYKVKLIQDKANPAMFMVSFFALPQQNNQSNNVQSSQKPAQTEQNQPEPIQTRPAKQEEKDKQIDQLVRTISYTLMHDSSDNADSFEPAQNDSATLEPVSDSTQKDDAAKTQKVNAAKHKKHIAKKRVVKRHKKHAKKYHLKRRSRKHTKRAKKRIIKHRKSVSRKFRKHNLKHVKRN